MKKIIDARGLDCPKPILETKKALTKGDATELEIMVDNKAARDNLKRFLEKSGYPVTKISELNGDYIINIQTTTDAPGITEEKPAEQNDAAGKTIFIGSDAIGHGSDELGRKLMKAFTFTLTELPILPQRLLFMNSGVYLCLNDSDSLASLRKLESRGVDILVCGTCLDFLGVTDKLAIGKVSNMYDIAGHLIDDEMVIKV